MRRILAFGRDDIAKLRKDTLTLIKAAEKESSYEEALHVRQAIAKFQRYVDTLFYEQMAPQIKDKKDNEQFRKVTWRFYIDMYLPISDADDYYDKKARYQQWLQKKEAWLNALRRRARDAWKVIDELFLGGEQDKPIVLKKNEKQNIEGFSVVFEYDPDNYAAVVEGIKIAARSLARVFPASLKRRPVLIFTKKDNIDFGGEYIGFERKILINLYQFSKYVREPKAGARLIVHEIAHDIYANYLSDEAHKYWHAAITNDYGVLLLSEIVKSWTDEYAEESLYSVSRYLVTKDPILALKLDILMLYGDFSRKMPFRSRKEAQEALEKGDVEYSVPKSPITPYAFKNPMEAFCEAFSTYAVYGERAVLPVVKSWLKAILPEMKITGSFKQKVLSVYTLQITKSNI